MTRRISNRTNSKRGSYTVEAAIFLPLLILAVLTIGMTLKTDSAWESCIYGAIDESTQMAAMEGTGVDLAKGIAGPATIESRLSADNPHMSYIDINRYLHGYSQGGLSNLTSFNLSAEAEPKLPLGFSRSHSYSFRIKYRGFVGNDYGDGGMGAKALETATDQTPVTIFPQAGIKYHGENCTYVKACVHGEILTSSLKRRYSSCGLCDSNSIALGSTVFCFNGENTAYHRGNCPSINRHYIVIDKSEAIAKGYTPCSKCGGKN